MTDIDPGIRFPGESEEYRRTRNRLLEAEAGLRRAIEQVAAQRRALPPGGVVPDDYPFEEASDGSEVRLSELFEAGKDTLVIYSFMFPRYSGDSRPGPAEGETAQLPLAETPCASCTSILDSLDGAARHLGRRLNLAAVAKSDPDRIRNFARERGWRHHRPAETLRRARGHEHRGACGGPPEQGREREQEQARDEGAPLAEQVGRAPAEHEQARERDRVRVHDPRQIDRGEAEARADRGQRHVDDRDVENHHELRRAAHRQQQGVARTLHRHPAFAGTAGCTFTVGELASTCALASSACTAT